MRRRLRVEVSHDLCVGTSMCVQIAPGAFRLDSEGLSEFEEAGEWDVEDVLEAVDSCPMSAIRVVEEVDD